jgi:predicted O-methyltransferase YrrM
MICHGELALMRPTPKHLTEFYLILSAGGAFGGVFVGLIAPKVFVSFLELQLALAVVFLCSGWLVLRSLSSDDPNMKHKRLILSVAGVLVVYVLASNARAFQTGAVLQSRNFFGVLRVTEEDADTPELHRYLQYHGRILHGFEYTSPERRHLPNAYYRPDGGLGLAMRLVRNAEGRHIGVVGLGVGTIAAYGEAADRLRFYEINPDVIDQAQQFFHYLRDTKAAVSVIPGDGRLSLAAEDAQAFDILVLDAFSGDAVPAHLLTTEAFEIYDRHLQSSGVIVINITNAHIDLRPVVAAIAEQRGITWRVVRSAKDPARGFQAADWMLLSRNEKFLSEPELVSAASATEGAFERILWTDNSNNLFRILK